MKRLLLLLAMCSGCAEAQTLDSLYGTWEIARDTTAAYDAGDGPVSYTILHQAIRVSAGEIVGTTISDLPSFGGGPGYAASATSYRYRPDGLVLAISDTMSIELALVGERLRMTWRSSDVTLSDALYDRAEADASDAILGTWLAPVVDAGIAFDVSMHITRPGERSEPGSLSVLGDYLLVRKAVTFQAGDPLADMAFYSAAPYKLSPDGRVLTVDRDPPERWVRSE